MKYLVPWLYKPFIINLGRMFRFANSHPILPSASIVFLFFSFIFFIHSLDSLPLVNMRGLQMGIGAFALANTANAAVRRWTYPDCEADNCYRAFINEQYTDLAPSFCLEFLASTTTEASVVPTPFKVCNLVAIHELTRINSLVDSNSATEL